MNSNPRIGDPADFHISEEALEKSRNSTQPKKPLWCIAYTDRIRPGVLKGGMLYVHADDQGDALKQYLFSECNTPLEKLRQREIVGVARVIGYFVNDNHGEDLSV